MQYPEIELKHLDKKYRMMRGRYLKENKIYVYNVLISYHFSTMFTLEFPGRFKGVFSANLFKDALFMICIDVLKYLYIF